MSTAEWLSARDPAPPAPLRAALEEAVGTTSPDARELAELARRELAAAGRVSGRVRTSAFQLLTADALLTYACEAALEDDDPVAVLRALLNTRESG